MSKKLVLAIAVLAVVCAGAYMVRAGTVTNDLGQVITTTVGADGVTVTITDPNAKASASNRVVSAQGCQLEMSDNTTQTLFTPRNYGDMLIGKEGGTGKVWVATGLTTNDWKVIYDP